MRIKLFLFNNFLYLCSYFFWRTKFWLGENSYSYIRLTSRVSITRLPDKHSKTWGFWMDEILPWANNRSLS